MARRIDRAAPEALHWSAAPGALQRLRRAAAVPLAAGAVIFVAVVIFAIASVWTRPNVQAASPSDSVAVEHGSATGDAGEASASTGPALETDPERGGSKLVVHVVGEVHAPGVYELEPGSRVSSAIDAAGGSTDQAFLEGVNLARLLVDGEQIIVPDSAAPVTAGADAASTGSADGTVHLNTADLEQLQTLPRVGPALAQRILDWRTANGPFTSIEQLLDVSGIGPKTLEQIREHVTV